MTARPERTTSSRWRLWLLRLALAAGSVGLACLAIEVLLVTGLLPISPATAKYVYGCYEKTQPARYIHGSLRPLKVSIHRPNFESQCYSLGHSWRHRSDAYGWRNPETWQSADVVLLGDSMIYGHGVEQDQTLAHFLRESTDARVVNMGIVGGSPVHYLAYLNNFALPLEPGVVVVLTFGNDLKDIRGVRPMSKIRRFARTGKGRETKVYPRSALLEEIRYPQHPAAWHDRFALSRMLEYQVRAREKRRQAPAPPASPAPPAPITRSTAADSRPPGGRAQGAGSGRPKPPTQQDLDKMERLFTVRYLRRAFREMAASSRAAGVTLVAGHIGRRTPTDYLLRRIHQELSAEEGFLYFDVPELLGPDYRLAVDGHFNENGNRTLAEALAAFLRGQRLLEANTDPGAG